MGQYRIGILAGNKNDDYLHSIRLGVQNTLEEAGEVLINVADLIPYHTSSNTTTYLRVAFEIAGRLNLDAVIVPLGSVTNYVEGGFAVASEFLDELDPNKTVVMERPVPGYRCLTKDNVPGMRGCMRHLIEGCGFKKICFVSGPKTSSGAKERESVYYEEMAAHNLEVTSTMLVHGEFSGDCYDAIAQVIDNNPGLEAIACASDLIAQTAYAVMRDRKLVVGRDIAVTGFDDQVRSAHLDPPLSTVHMTGYDFGCMAAREAMRLCAGEPQKEYEISSVFIARASCGEDTSSERELCRRLVRDFGINSNGLLDFLVDNTLFLAGPGIRATFRASAAAFLDKVHAAYLAHHEHPGDDDVLFLAQDLAELFGADYKDHLSFEGFHAAAIMLLEGLLALSDEDDVDWVYSQISYLHLRVARLLNDATQAGSRSVHIREWSSFHLVEHALIEDISSKGAYKLMLEELDGLGVRQADLFLLPEATRSMGGQSLALSDALRFIGSLDDGAVFVADGSELISLQEVLARVLPRYKQATVCTVAGIMAGNELLGIVTIDPGALDDNGQLMSFLNMGLACKHLQMLATEREMNDLLNENNLLLERQSQRDAMTGLLNRRGLDAGIAHMVLTNPDSLATLLYLDMDGLKSINDTMGHDMGDEAICAAAQILTESLPDDCLLARMGGDEFVVFSQVQDEADANVLVDAVQRSFAEFNGRGSSPFELSLSCGIVCFSTEDGAEEAVRKAMMLADARMYEVKRKRKQSRSFQKAG